MKKEERYKGVLDWFEANVPVAETELHYDDPYQLLIAVILSAQCTDKRVNMITPALFRDSRQQKCWQLPHRRSYLNISVVSPTRTINRSIWSEWPKC